jgi:hypothetical protein
MSSHVKSCQVMSSHVKSCQVMSGHVKSCRRYHVYAREHSRRDSPDDAASQPAHSLFATRPSRPRVRGHARRRAEWRAPPHATRACAQRAAAACAEYATRAIRAPTDDAPSETANGRCGRAAPPQPPPPPPTCAIHERGRGGTCARLHGARRSRAIDGTAWPHRRCASLTSRTRGPRAATGAPRRAAASSRRRDRSSARAIRATLAGEQHAATCAACIAPLLERTSIEDRIQNVSRAVARRLRNTEREQSSGAEAQEHGT